jgi:hypothetical protein
MVTPSPPPQISENNLLSNNKPRLKIKIGSRNPMLKNLQSQNGSSKSIVLKSKNSEAPSPNRSSRNPSMNKFPVLNSETSTM